MEPDPILHRLQAEFDTPPKDILAIVALLDAGAPPMFISEYRRDETGDPGKGRCEAIAERLIFLRELEVRKKALNELARDRQDELGELARSLESCFDQDFIDDLDHALRPHEHTAHARVAALGLANLVDAISRHDLGGKNAQEAATPYISAEKGLPDEEVVLETAALALAERWGENPELRKQVRVELFRGILKAVAVSPGKKTAKRYEDFFDFKEPVRSLSPARMLALRKAEREGIITVHLHLPDGRELEIYRKRFSPEVDPKSPLGEFLDLVYEHSYQTLVHPSCEATVRLKIKERVDRETVRSFGHSLRAQLLAPPLGPKKCMALRASGKNLWVVVLGEDGAVLVKESHSTDGEELHEKALQAIKAILGAHHPAMVAVPHNRREEHGLQLLHECLKEIDAGQRPGIIPMDETPSLVYATSPGCRRRMPSTETGMRTTINLAQRLRDPLRELIRIEPRGLGLGHNLTEVHQGMLNRMLEATASSCIGLVGVDINAANADYIARLPGMEREWAQKIVQHRAKNGKFSCLAAIQAADLLEPNQLRWVAGFLRIYNGTEALDATAIHPDDYPLVARVAEAKGVAPHELLGKRHRDVDLQALITPETGRMRILDLLAALEHPNSDPRGVLAECKNPGLQTLADLKLDQRIQGRITSLTEFGAFADIGIGHHGLIHMSQIPGSRLRNPAQCLKVGEVVAVYVVGLNEKEKRIALSMHKPRHLAEGRQATVGERMGKPAHRGRRGRDEEPRVFSRAARSPDGRGRGRPGRKPAAKSKKGEFDPRESGDPLQRRGSRGLRNPSQPRIITVESEQTREESRGIKGELRSLSGLKALLEKQELGKDPPKGD